MSYKYQGENYDSNLSLKEIAQKIRDYAKTDKILGQCKWSVRTSYASMCQSLSIKLMEAPYEAFIDTCRDYERWNQYHDEAEKNGLTLLANEAMKRMRDYVESYNFDDSDPYTDYFHTNFYSDYGVGSYEKPFKKVALKNKRTIRKKVEVVEGLVEISLYTDKSFVVHGDTKPIKELLKILGGRFNTRLNMTPCIGWVFPISQMEAVKSMLNI